MKCTKVYFYEWSDVKRQPLVFNIDNFKKFCQKSNIKITNTNDWYLTNYPECHITCKIDKPELIISHFLIGLKKNVSKYNCKNKHL